jgi:hypothetical protein
MRKQISIVVLGIAFSALFNFALAENAPSKNLLAFDEEVAQCRRVVREYCAIVQEMMSEEQLDESKQTKGIELLQQTRMNWDGLIKKWGDNPPPEYSSDHSFKTRLVDFSEALEDMERTLSEGSAHRSFKSCSYGCGLFVTMHEQNGISCALDALYHFRKAAKTAGALLKSNDVDKVNPMLENIMHLRDAVLVAPAPWQEGDQRLAPYYEAVKKSSSLLDDFALAIADKDLDSAKKALKELLVFINEAYGLAL